MGFKDHKRLETTRCGCSGVGLFRKSDVWLFSRERKPLPCHVVDRFRESDGRQCWVFSRTCVTPLPCHAASVASPQGWWPVVF
ncbi:hypothetical protein Hanom_Chr06g00566361 [Helianthus anomalus]